MNRSNELLIKNARLIDGIGTSYNDLQSIYIQNGKIEKIAPNINVSDVRELDVSGASVLPGLIDAHVHLQSVPGSVYRDDSEEALEKYRLLQLRAYLACGVTTVLDNAIEASMLRKFHDHLESGGTGPDLYALAPAFYPPNGYLDNDMLTKYWGPQWKAAGSKEDIESLFKDYDGIKNIVGIKTMLDSGSGKSNIWPLHSPEIRKLIVDEAKKRALPLYIHAYKKKEQSIGLDMGVHNFVHSGFIFKKPTKEFISRMKKKGTYLTTTLSCTFDQLLVQFDPERLNTKGMEITVPDELIATARDPEAWKYFYNAFFRNSSPKWMPSFVLNAIPKLLNIEKMLRTCLNNATQAIVSLHKAGVPIVVGTDASSWPVFLNFFHGTSTIREIELLGNAGIPAIDVISSATKIPAEMMGIQDLTGTVEAGKKADLIVVRKNPLEDLRTLRSLMWTIKDGVARTPKEWMGLS